MNMNTKFSKAGMDKNSNMLYIPKLGYDQNFKNFQEKEEFESENFSDPNQFSEGIEKLFTIIQSELESIDCENMLSNLENILTLVKEDITRKFTTSKNLQKIEEIFQNNFEIVKDYFKRCLSHTISVKISLIESVKNGLNELNDLHTQEVEREKSIFANHFNVSNKSEINLQVFDENLVELVNNLSTIIKEYVKNTRVYIKTLKKDSDINANKYIFIKSNLTNFLSQNLQNSSFKNLFNNQNKIIKSLIEKFEEIETTRFESNKVIKFIDNTSIRFYEDAKVIFKNLKNLHNTKLQEIQNLNTEYNEKNIKHDYSSSKFTSNNFNNTQNCLSNTQMSTKLVSEIPQIKLQNLKSKSIDALSRQEKRKADSVSPGIKINNQINNLTHLNFNNPQRKQINNSNVNNTSSGNSFQNTSTNLENSYSYTHSNFTNSRNQINNKRLNKLNKSVDSFNSRNVNNLSRIERANSQTKVSNTTNHNVMDMNSNHIESYNKLLTEFELIKNQNAELNLELMQLHEAFADSQYENQRLKKENDMYYRHLIKGGPEPNLDTNLNISNQNKLINKADLSKSPIKSRSSQIIDSESNPDKSLTTNINTNMNINKIANLVISFINHMSALQEAINKKLSNVKEMKKEFELKKKELTEFANFIINNNIKSGHNLNKDRSDNLSKNLNKFDDNDIAIYGVSVSQIDQACNIEKPQAVVAKNVSSTVIFPCEKCKNTNVEIENYNLQIKNLNDDKEKLGSEILSLTEEIKKLNSYSVNINKLEVDNKILIEEISRMKDSNEELVNENKKLFSDNQQMAEEFTKLQDYFQTMEDAKIAEIKSAEEIEKKKLYIKDLEEKLKSLSEESKSKKAQIETLSHKIDALIEEKNSLSEIIDENKTQIENLLQKNFQFAEDKKSFIDQITSLNTKLKNLLESNNISTKLKISLESDLKESGEKISNFQNEIKKMKIDFDKKLEENRILSKNMELIEKKLIKEINDKSELQTKFEFSKNELTSQENKLKEYEMSIIPNLKKVQEKYEKKIEQEFEIKLQQFYETLSLRENELIEIKENYNKLQQQRLTPPTSSNENLNLNSQNDSFKLKILELEKNSKKYLTENENLKKDYNAICHLIDNTFYKVSIKLKNLHNLLKEKTVTNLSSKNQSKTLYNMKENKLTNISEIEENLIIDEVIEIKEEEDEELINIERKFECDENRSGQIRKKDDFTNYKISNEYNHFSQLNPSSIIEKTFSMKEIEKTLTEFSQMILLTFNTVEEKVKSFHDFPIREHQYIEENSKLKTKFDECIQIIYDTITMSSPHLLDQFGFLDNESDSNVSDSIKKEIEIDFIQKAVELFKSFVNEMNEEHKKLKVQLEEMKIYKIKAEEYKSVLDMAILNKEENSYRKKTKDSHRNFSNFNNESSNYTFTRENIEGNAEIVYENNLTVDDLIEDKNIFLEIVKKERNQINQINQMNQNQSESKCSSYHLQISHQNEEISKQLKKKNEEIIEIKKKYEDLMATKQEEIIKMEILVKEEHQKAIDYKNKYEEMLQAIENESLSLPNTLKIKENSDDKEAIIKKTTHSSTNYNKIDIPKLHLKAINKSFNNKEDFDIEDDEDEDNYLEKLNNRSLNQYQSEKNQPKENQNFKNKISNSNKNLNHTVGIIKDKPGIDYFAKLNKTYNKDLSYVNTNKSVESVETENLQEHIYKLEENEQLLLEQLTALKEELKQTRIQRDQYKKIVEDSSKLDDKTEIVKALKPMIEKLIAEIVLNDKIKQILAVILKILSCSDDQIKQIFMHKEMNKKTFFGNFFGVK